MFSLVEFDNDEYYIALSKHVNIIEEKDCIVKYKGGSKYQASVLKISDSKQELKDLQEYLESEPPVVISNTNKSTSNNIESETIYDFISHSYEIHEAGCSTPINEQLILPPEPQLTLSDIVDDRRTSTTLFNNSAESSAPPSGCTDIINVVGEVWMKDFGSENPLEDVRKLNEIDSNCLINSENSTHDQNNQNITERKERDEHDEQLRNKQQDNCKKQDENAERNNFKERDDEGCVNGAEQDERGKGDDNEDRDGNDKQKYYTDRHDQKISNNEKRNSYEERDGKEGNYQTQDENAERNNSMRQDDEGCDDGEKQGEREESDDNEERDDNDKQKNYTDRHDQKIDNNEKRNSHEERDGEEDIYQTQDENAEGNNSMRRDEGCDDGKRQSEREESDDNEERDDNDKQKNYTDRHNQKIDNNERRNSYEERDGEEDNYQTQDENAERNNCMSRDDEGCDDRERQGKRGEGDDNEERGNIDKQKNYKKGDDTKRTSDEEIQDDDERNYNKIRKNNKRRKNYKRRDNRERIGDCSKSTGHNKPNNNENDSEDQRRYGNGQNNEDQDINDEESNDDDTANDSDYIPDQSTSNQTFDISQGNLTRNLSRSIIEAPPVDIRSVKVLPSKDQEKKIVKKYFCPYCKKLQTKFTRHLELKHASEADVGKFIKLPKGNYERTKIIETIRKYGNFLHNTDSNLNTGILITCRQHQPKYNRIVEDYVCCSNCKGFFSKQTLRLHTTKCNPTRKKGVRDITVTGRRLTGYIHELANVTLRRTVFPVMRDDVVVRSIKYDELIILYGNRLCDKYTDSHQHDMIRAQLRLLGRFKCAIKKINKEIDDFASIFHPKYYDDAILAVRQCAKYNQVTHTFEKPAVATMLGTLLKKCIGRRKAQCIRKQNYDGKQVAEEFLTLFEDDYPTTINKKVIADQTEQKRKKNIILPSNQDIRRLYDFLRKKCQTSLKTLDKKFELSAWKELAECTLILVQIFNRRRAGEIERLLITDYQNQTELNENVNADLFAKLTDEAREYAKQFARLTIRGKLGRTVPVLLYPLHVSCIDMILKYRTEAGIEADNKYIFSVPTTGHLKKKYLRACILMRKFSQECGAVMPRSLRGTTLRKHIATFFAMEGIGENEVAELANFMGHDKQIHKDVYRVPIPIREVTHVSRLLQAAMGESENEESSDEPDDEPNDEPNDETFGEVSWRNACAEISANSIYDSDIASEEFPAGNNNTGKEESSLKRRSTSPYGKTKRTRWSTEEKTEVQRIFGDPTTLKKLPSLKECQDAIQKCKILKNRQPQVLKTWIDNQRKSLSRRGQS